MLEHLKTPENNITTLIIGMESSGKTTLFSKLSGEKIGNESNVKGSTVYLQTSNITNGTLIDTPGINNTISITQNGLKEEINKNSNIILVVRGTHFVEELKILYPHIEKVTKRIILFVTFSDKMSQESKIIFRNQIVKNKLPLFIVDTRKLDNTTINLFLECLSKDDSISKSQLNELMTLPINNVEPPNMYFERNYFGKFLALLSLFSMFLLPVILAYHLSNFLQPLLDKFVLSQTKPLFNQSPRIFQEIFVGDYGLITLGVYSFIWAFPVVLLISCSKAITDESGIKDRIIDTIEPLLKKIGLTGRDILPIITGFGCNVVAVYQSRGCHSCNRSQCVSFISFGSACSYQIGATLSIFNSAGAVWLFIPYLLLLTVGGIIHNNLWFKKHSTNEYNFTRKTFIQKPNLKRIIFHVKSDIFQFLRQAMPIFMGICIIASLLHYMNIISLFAFIFNPILQILHLPLEGATTLAFSIIRKDGILILNEGNGELLDLLSNFQLFLLVFLASTLTSCIVTLSTIWKELGLTEALKLIYKQSITSILLGIILMVGNSIIHFI